jgi:hypothetical protein
VRITHKLHEIISGAPLSIPITATGSWSDSMTSVGSGRFRIPLALSRFTPAEWEGSTVHWWHMIAEYWDGHPMYFGLIKDKVFDFDTNMLELSTVTVDDLFSNRYTFGVANYDDGDLSIESQTLRAALVQVLQRGMAWGGTWPLPFDFVSPTVEGGAFSQDWKRHDWKRISDLVKIIQSQDGGPDLAFVPKVTAQSYARWDVHTGSPRIDGPTIDLPVSVRRSLAKGVRLKQAGGDMASGTMVRGEGLGKGRPYGWAGFMDGPAMVVRDTARDMVANDANLMSIAQGDLKRLRSPTEQYEYDLVVGDASNPFPIRDLRLGTRFNFRHSGNAYRAAESQTHYLVAMAHDTSNPHIVNPEVQPL